ncbi:MAG: alpha/beta hydrolase [Burkholderiaceae bacterium]|nr:alpha/beta hydrolase [Roseateles sp.]MBV8470885.1 alpha/beta hydrolase [Burkholderiaceae bacterium]
MEVNAPVATWVLLRGLTRGAGHWGGFPALLEQRLQARQGGVRLVLLELPGNGSLYRMPSPTHVHEMVDFCRAELRARGIAGPIHLLAMSLGAMVAADWAHRFAQDLRAVVLINTSLRPFSAFYQRLRPANYLRLVGLLLARSPQARESVVLRLTTRRVADESGVIAWWVDLQSRQPVSTLNALRQLLAAMRYVAPRQPIPVPILILGSRSDGLVNYRCSEQLSRAWQVPLVTHERAGHDLPLDDGPWVAQAVCDWLAGEPMPGA